MKRLKKMLTLGAGGALLAAGLLMLVLPGPAFVVIPTALAILATECAWAQRCLAWLNQRLRALAQVKRLNTSTGSVNAPMNPQNQQG